MAFMRARLGKMESLTSKSLVFLWEWCSVVFYFIFFFTECQRILMAAVLWIFIWLRIVGLCNSNHFCTPPLLWELRCPSRKQKSYEVEKSCSAEAFGQKAAKALYIANFDLFVRLHHVCTLAESFVPFVRQQSFQTQHPPSGGSRSVSKYLNLHTCLNRNAKAPSILLSWHSYSLGRALSKLKKGHQGLTTHEETPSCICRASSKKIISLWSF